LTHATVVTKMCRVSTDDLKTRARELRAAGQTPKQIARTLNIPRARVNDLVRGVKAVKPAEEELPLLGCWVSYQWSVGLSIADRPSDWVDHRKKHEVGTGLVNILVARDKGDGQVSVCGFLVDTYCLGVKNAVPPSLVEADEFADFLDDYYRPHPDPGLAAPVELVRELVFGAVEYARGLGFDPHPDFYLASTQLGGQRTGQITFGREGRPCFQNGPYDDVDRVIRTLERTAGSGKYDFVVMS
jgi:hypothetical protein